MEETAVRGATAASTVEAEARAVAFISMSKSVNQIRKIFIVRNQGFRRLKIENWK